MISTSVPLMTLVDVAIIALGVYAAVTLYRYREPVAALGVMRSALTMLAGVAFVAAINLGDLVAMHALPLLMGRERAMQVMETLLREWSGWATLLGVAAIVFGLVLLTRDLLPRTATAMRRMERLNEELSSRGVELERRISAIARKRLSLSRSRRSVSDCSVTSSIPLRIARSPSKVISVLEISIQSSDPSARLARTCCGPTVPPPSISRSSAKRSCGSA